MLGSEEVIVVKDLFKSFKLPHEQSTGIKQNVVNFLRRKKGYENQEVLRDVSFSINKGEFFGIVGRNGSGKSTLLKLLAGIYNPNKGSISINGSLTPFIELGVGFNPELTGRENVYLNGALLGFSRTEMNDMYDSIVEFAELERFMDQKLRNYSSGMQVRLAFSIAIKAESDILILDEVLAVGDAEFQQKCSDYFEKQKAKGQTIVLVTHDMASVQKYCTRAIMIEDGSIIASGNPETVAFEYTKANQIKIENNLSAQQAQTPPDLHDIKTYTTDTTGKRLSSFDVGDSVLLHMEWKNEAICNAGAALIKQSGEGMFATNTLIENVSITGKSCDYRLSLDVAPGKYFFKIRLFGKTENDNVTLIEEGPSILIRASKNNKVDGLVSLDHKWLKIK